MAISYDTLPTTPDELTAAWLTAALVRSGEMQAGRQVRDVTHERIAEGVGFIGLNVRVHLEYDAAYGAGPATLIAKFPSPDEGSRAIGNLYGLYEREVRFYGDLAGRVGLSTPRCYFAAWDAGAGRSLILLEDLAHTGDVGDQVAGCSGDQAAIALEALASFHARWWRNPELADIAWLPNGADLVRGSMTQAYPAVWAPFLELHGHFLSPAARAAVPKLAEKTLQLMDLLEARGDLTLIHGDYRLDNMFFGRPGASYGMTVIDWQSPNRGWGAYDIAYFISGSLPPEERRACEMDVLRLYHERLVAGGVPDYPFETLFEDYRRSLLAYLAIFVVNGATLEMTNARAVELFETIFTRLSAAIEDLGALALLPA